jgi:hypothetical protein
MSDGLEKALREAGYSALPLPRGKNGPTTIFSFIRGYPYVVRSAGKCLPDPPIQINKDPTANLIQFDREFESDAKGILGTLANLFGTARAKAHFHVKAIKRATIKLGRLAHVSIATGDMVDFLAAGTRARQTGQRQAITGPDMTEIQVAPLMRECEVDLFDKENLTIVAALRANTFEYQFFDGSGTAVKLDLKEVSGLFGLGASAKVQVTSEGKVVVKFPTYVGIVTWNGRNMYEAVQKRLAGSPAPAPRLMMTGSSANARQYALTPDAVDELRLESLNA